MAKRENNYSLTQNRNDYKVPTNIEATLDYLEINGKLPNKKVMPPNLINERCLDYYSKILVINKQLDSNNVNIELLKYEKSILQTKIINLVSIIIGSVIKRFKTLYPTYYSDVFTECVMDILIKINKNQYNPDKSSFHSYCYETSF
jgi:hypothetical protein